ncbi:hypothetical protein HOT82_gp071 [Gordonia phage Ronaldo]|uniref:Uncharacterized protein n=3 Tax=Ronaldovirus ronaldo TaxID=2734270 RepID=A0A6B9L888_9CAUD|nr:hypothetical protein HOT82_gp071 [Gordonia phage Ronaldo]AXN53633.1 hypothetical protein SEA_RONALDO_71 [Gordonia phage Ronaldo]QDH48410.1 hypothetical protein SEA_ZIKO_71 [Gordonia phage Ziko]QHB38187.1 hypothetical protein SEA_VOLT_71 [Gordonia phage Volt]
MSNKRIELSDNMVQAGWTLASETERGQLFQFRPTKKDPVDSSLFVRYTKNNVVAEANAREGVSGAIIGRLSTDAKDKRRKVIGVLTAANS